MGDVMIISVCVFLVINVGDGVIEGIILEHPLSDKINTQHITLMALCC
jgi:hypothetical protein